MDTVANHAAVPAASLGPAGLNLLAGDTPFPDEKVLAPNQTESPPPIEVSSGAYGEHPEARQQDFTNRHDAILDALPAHVALLDAEGNIVAVNEAWRRFGAENVLQMDGYCLGSNYVAVCEAAQGECSREAPAVAEGIRRVLDNTLQEFSLEYPCHSPNEQRWFRLIVTPLQLGRRAGAVVMHINITERKLAENALLESEERFRRMFLDAATGICICTPQGRFLQANAAYCTMLGYTEEELLSLDFVTITHPEDRTRNMELVGDLLEGRVDSFVLIKRYIGKTGNPVWCRVSVSAQRNAARAPVNLIAVAEDITQQREAEEELAKSQALLRMATHVSRLGAWSIEVATGSLYWSGDNVMFPDVPEDFVPTLEGALAVCAPAYRNAVADAFVACVRDGSTFDVEFEVVGDERSRGWVRAIGEPVPGADGATIRVQGAFQDITALKCAQKRENQLAEQLANTLECITDGFLMLDHDANVTYMNESAETILERPRNELLGKNIRSEFSEYAGTLIDLQYQRVMSDGIPTEFDHYFPKSDRWLGIRVFPIPDGFAIYVKDVSENRRARRAIEESEERFRLLSKATNDAIWDWDLNADIIWWNEGIETIFGFHRDEVGASIAFWESLIHPDEKDRVYKSVLHAIASHEEQWSAEYRFRRKDKTYVYVLDRGYIIRDARGKAVRMLGCITDLTSKKLAEARLREQAALIDLASDAIMVRDLNQRVLFWNRSAENIYGWREAEVLGKSVMEFLIDNPDDLKIAEEAVLRDGVWSGEAQHRTRGGGRVTVFARWTLVRDDDGNPSGVLAINSDITERRALEQQFFRAQRMESIGTLAGGIAHDLNNVLAPILLSVDMLRERIDDDNGRAMLDTVQKCAQRGAELIKQVLTFARGNDAREVPLNPSQIVREVEQIIYDTFPRNIHCEIKVPADLLHIKADPTQLHQMLMNLCVNARDAMPGGGTLSIHVENRIVDEVYSGMSMDARPGSYVVFVVSDTGVGISRELHDRIFEPFFSTKDIGQGTGLGLSTTFAIVKDHRGFLDMESEPGKGSVFRAYLPAIQVPEPNHEAAPTPDRLPVGHGETILVVDDEENIRDVTRKALERFGYRVLTAANGAEGVSLYVQNQCDIAVVLTDMSMPVMDGPAMIFALKSINPQVHIIGSSGLTSEDSAAKAIRTGVDRFVPKPYTASALLHILHELLAGCRAPETDQLLVLVSDHDERESCCSLLELEGYTVRRAATKEEAGDLLDVDAARFRMFIVDANLAHPIGERLRDRVARLNPDFRVLLLVGAEDHLPVLESGFASAFNVIEKPLRAEAFARKVRACLSR